MNGYSDPTFHAVLRIEERGCRNCYWRVPTHRDSECANLRVAEHLRPKCEAEMHGCSLHLDRRRVPAPILHRERHAVS